uniref:RING-type E3 ubiquitin transferase n=1 Tax=Leersia perrieri TaxID=77586 RepID=A0A0D9VH66_9ORYZ
MVRGVEQAGAASSFMDSSSPSPTISAQPGQAMTVSGIATVAAVLIVFATLTLAFVLLQCYCDERRRAVTSSSSSTTRGPRRRQRIHSGGVDPDVLRSLPITVYRAPAAAKEDGDVDSVVECAVCLAELEDGEEARFLPRCGHGFHAGCVDTWLASHSTCPLCRLAVVKPDDAYSTPPPILIRPVAPEPPARYAGSHGAASVTTEGIATGVLVIEIPESAASTPRDVAARSPRLSRSLRRLCSFGRQGVPAGSSCSGAGDGGVEHGVSVAVGIRVVEAPAPELTAARPSSS